MSIDLASLSPAPWFVGPAPEHEVFDAERAPVNEKGLYADMAFE
jgi:hypothetical protein